VQHTGTTDHGHNPLTRFLAVVHLCPTHPPEFLATISPLRSAQAYGGINEQRDRANGSIGFSV